MLAGCSLKEAAGDPTEKTVANSLPSPGPSAPEPETIEVFPALGEEPETVAPPEDGVGRSDGVDIIIATDLHYLGTGLTDFGTGFTYTVEHGDGKLVNYIWQITDAFLDEVAELSPDVLILSGDLSYNGELRSHEELAEKLYRLNDAGIQVLVIPGNHDIGNRGAAQFYEDVKSPAEPVTPGQFEQIYQDFGYRQAINRDEGTLSYVYQLNDYIRVMMLDTCQYEPVNLVGGMIDTDTYVWIDEQLEDAWNNGMSVIPVAHHNLLEQSEIYVDDCTIEHSEELTERLEGWQIPLFLSGHLHVQHYKRSGSMGIAEIVTSSLATPPCQYGILHYGSDGSFRYQSKIVDMENWARKNGSTVTDLLTFKEFGKRFLGKVFYNQAQDEFKRNDVLAGRSEEEKDLMATLYSRLNSAYYAGKAVELIEEAARDPGYALWQEYGYDSILCQYLEYIISRADADYNQLSSD